MYSGLLAYLELQAPANPACKCELPLTKSKSSLPAATKKQTIARSHCIFHRQLSISISTGCKDRGTRVAARKPNSLQTPSSCLWRSFHSCCPCQRTTYSRFSTMPQLSQNPKQLRILATSLAIRHSPLISSLLSTPGERRLLSQRQHHHTPMQRKVPQLSRLKLCRSGRDSQRRRSHRFIHHKPGRWTVIKAQPR